MVLHCEPVNSEQEKKANKTSWKKKGRKEEIKEKISPHVDSTIRLNPRSHHKPDLKVVLLGGPAVGKTTLMKRYTERKYQENSCTIGANFVVKSWGNYLIAIWDTSGEEKYHSLSYFYCRNTNVAIVVFDITRRKTFEFLSGRYSHLLETLPEQCLKIVVGAKLDLLKARKREVSREEGEEFARLVNRNPFPRSTMPYFEVSSLTGENVDEVFEYGLEYFFPRKGAIPRELLKEGVVFEESDTVILNPDKMLVGAPVSKMCC